MPYRTAGAPRTISAEERTIGCMLGAAYGDSLGTDRTMKNTQQALCVAAACLHGVRRSGGINASFMRIREAIAQGAKHGEQACLYMSAHPVGLLYAGRPMTAFAIAEYANAMAAARPVYDANISAAILATIVSKLIGENRSVRAGITEAFELAMLMSPTSVQTVDMLRRALVADAIGGDLLLTSSDQPQDALAAGCAAALRFHDDLVDACGLAAAFGCHSSAVASIAGAIVGAHVGARGVPDLWRKTLECSAELIQRGSELAALNAQLIK